MKDSANLHLKVQELCDCYSTTDPLKEMSILTKDQDEMDSDLKWLALLALHGVNNNAKKISIKQSEEGIISVKAEYRDSQLPSPNADVAGNIFKAVKEILHIEEAKGESVLALGIKDSSLDLNISLKDKKGNKKITIKFP